MITCGEWQQNRSSGNKPSIYQAQAWIDGYLSGSNASGNGADFLAPKPSYMQATPSIAVILKVAPQGGLTARRKN